VTGPAAALEASLRELVAALVDEAVERRMAELAPPPSEHLTNAEAAAFMKIAPVTLEQARARGEGPPYSKAGRRILYRRSDVEAWLAEGRPRRRR